MYKNNTLEKAIKFLINYEHACIFDDLKSKGIVNIQEESINKYQKNFLDLTEDEVKNLSDAAKKEYDILLMCLVIEISNYTKATIIDVDTLRDIYNKLEEFKEVYYKKYPSKKK